MTSDPERFPVQFAVAGQTVFVHGLEVFAEIGLNPDERGRRQPLIIDASLKLEPRPPHHLRETYNYEGVVSAARALADGGHIELAETFALRLAAAILEHELVREVTVRVAKPEALKPAKAAGAEITLVRS
jgi:dihydroneopterin aldolase